MKRWWTRLEIRWPLRAASFVSSRIQRRRGYSGRAYSYRRGSGEGGEKMRCSYGARRGLVIGYSSGASTAL